MGLNQDMKEMVNMACPGLSLIPMTQLKLVQLVYPERILSFIHEGSKVHQLRRFKLVVNIHASQLSLS